MNRLPATRTLSTALLGTLLAMGSIAPAFAQQRGDDDEDKHDRRAARKEQNDQRRPQREEAQVQPRQQRDDEPLSLLKKQSPSDHTAGWVG